MTTTQVGKLDRDALNELLIRRQTVMHAKASYLMMQRGLHEYVNDILKKYKHNTKDNLSINLQTGAISLVTDPLPLDNLVASELEEAIEHSVDGESLVEIVSDETTRSPEEPPQ